MYGQCSRKVQNEILWCENGLLMQFASVCPGGGGKLEAENKLCLWAYEITHHNDIRVTEFHCG